MNKITNAESEVQPYPFTTQSLWAGHTMYKNVKWQVIDTPGILDRPLEERNTIEMQAITALAHLDAAILYFIDISEQCGYSLETQLSLFNSIRPLFKNKPIVIVLNKIDLQPFESMDKKYKDMIEQTAQTNNTYLIKMSNVSNEGIMDVKSHACDILLEYRLANTTKTLKSGNKLEQFENKIHITTPTPRDNRRRPVNIPSTVPISQLNEKKEISAIKNSRSDEEKLLDTLRNGEDEGHEKKILHNRVKEMIENKGGEGVFYIPDREHFILENPDWKDDVMPEIMDGKNIFDFIDVDIKEKLERLQEEEDQLLEEENQGMNVDDEQLDSDLDEELLEAHEDVMENRKKINTLHKSVKSSTLPRKVRDLTLTEKFMTDLRTDLKDNTDKLRKMSVTARNLEKDRTKKNIIKQARLREEDIESSSDEGMDVDDGKFLKKKRLSKEEKEKLEKEEKYKEEQIQRMKDKIQKKFNRKGIINETDRRIGSKLPKHLNTGKRGIGTADHR